MELAEEKGLELQGLIWMKNSLLRNGNDTSRGTTIGLDSAGRKRSKRTNSLHRKGNDTSRGTTIGLNSAGRKRSKKIKPVVLDDIHSVKSQKEKCVKMIK